MPIHSDVCGYFWIIVTELSSDRDHMAAFLNGGTTDIWGQVILPSEGCSVPCGVWSSIPGLHPLDKCPWPSLPSCDNQRCLKTLRAQSHITTPPPSPTPIPPPPVENYCHMAHKT